MKARTEPLPSGLFAAIFFTLLFIFAVTASRAQGQLTAVGMVRISEVSGEAPWFSAPLGINGFLKAVSDGPLNRENKLLLTGVPFTGHQKAS